MSLLSPPLGVRPREEQFVADLANLFRRHRVRTGSPVYLGMLAQVLETNHALRSDLLMLCNAISRLADTDLEPEELLQLIAKAVVNQRSDDCEFAIPDELRELFIHGWREWQARADSLSEIYWGELGTRADTHDPYKGKFATAKDRGFEPDSATPRAGAPGEVTSDTRLGELTLAQLRTYLEDIEQRVGRLQPYLENMPEIQPVAVSERGPDGLTNNFRAPDLAGTEEEFPAAAAAEPEPVLLTPLPAEVEHELIALNRETSTAPVTTQERGSSDRLVLREDSATEVDPRIDGGGPILFRSVSEGQGGRSRGVLWLAAALIMLAPAAYYARDYVYAPAATMPLGAPPAPGFVPPEPGPDPRATEQPMPASTLSRPASAAPRLVPRAVQMEAEAARAQQHETPGNH